MKRSLTLLLASLMLVFALTACGGRDNASQDSGQNGSQSESAAVGSDSANSGSTGGSNGHTGGTNGNSTTNGETASGGSNGSLLEDAGNAVEDGLNGMENAVDDITGNTAKNQNGSAGTHGT